MNQVDEVKSKTDIVAVIGEHVKLRRAGRNFSGLCPFHGEKTPSFMVNPELQRYKCFGCGVSGDVFNFLEEYEGMEFYEALTTLAEKAGVVLKKTGKPSQKAVLMEANELAANFYNYILINHKIGKPALNYLVKERGLSLTTIKKFNLGFAPEKRDALSKFLINKKKLNMKLLVDAGLVYKGNYGASDRFAGRVVFPIFDHRGNTIALAGRILGTAKRAKYINSPETEIYHKSDSLYGLNITKSAVKLAKHAVVVEGEFDLLVPWQKGIKNIVAIKGTAITSGQLRLLSRFVDKVTLALDSDFAGNEAALRGIREGASMGIEIEVMSMGRFKDPDEFIKQDPEGFQKQLRASQDIWDFMISFVFEKHKGVTGTEKAKVSRGVIPILSRIEDKIVQAHYVKKVASRLGVSESAVMNQMASSKLPAKKEEVELTPPKNKTRRDLLESGLIASVLQNNPKKILEEDIANIFRTDMCVNILSSLKKYLKDNKKYNSEKFVSKLPDNIKDFVINIMMTTFTIEDYELAHRELIILNNKEDRKGLRLQMQEAESTGDDNKLASLQNEFTKLSKELADLSLND